MAESVFGEYQTGRQRKYRHVLHTHMHVHTEKYSLQSLICGQYLIDFISKYRNVASDRNENGALVVLHTHMHVHTEKIQFAIIHMWSISDRFY